MGKGEGERGRGKGGNGLRAGLFTNDPVYMALCKSVNAVFSGYLAVFSVERSSALYRAQRPLHVSVL